MKKGQKISGLVISDKDLPRAFPVRQVRKRPIIRAIRLIIPALTMDGGALEMAGANSPLELIEALEAGYEIVVQVPHVLDGLASMTEYVLVKEGE